MGTIITVHGTNDTGPAGGDNWWQMGSVFELHLRDLVEADDGHLIFEPFIWDGQNSEASRYAAGERLYTLTAELERDNEPYCILAHSHGGSVIAHALTQCIGDRRVLLDRLSKWITVGTPFIHSRRKYLLFERLSLMGQSAYIMVFFLLLALAAALFVFVFKLGSSLVAEDIVLMVVSALLFGGLMFAVAHFFQPRKLACLSPRRMKAARQAFAHKWVGFVHANDEAIQGLLFVRNLKFSPFRPEFSVGTLTFLSIFVLPLAIAFASTFDSVAGLVQDTLRLVGAPPLIEDRVDRFDKVCMTIFSVILLPVGAVAWFGKALGLTSVTDAAFFFVFSIGTVLSFMLLFATSLAILQLARILSGPVSAAFSYILNNSTETQLRRSAWGGDTIGEFPIGASDCPHWIEHSPRVLPDALGREIEHVSNEAASQSVEKLRAALRILAFSEKNIDNTDMLSEYLTWKELIHTTYFHVPRFRKLVAYAIATSPGFRPSATFEADIDFPTVARWYREITAPPGSSTSPPPLPAAFGQAAE